MRKVVLKLMLAAITTSAVYSASAQQEATFENLELAADSYWNGSAAPNGTTFTSGDAVFPNYFKSYWSKGWAYSNKKDSTTPGNTNMYSAVTGIGYNSDNYAIGQQNSIIRLNGNAAGGKINGVYITNGTYAVLSMRNGDDFARKFGDTTGTHSGLPQGSYPDWFKLTIKGYSNGALTNDSVDFYLADYRFADNSLDYIVKTWKWVDLTTLGNVDSVIFNLTSSDVGAFGMNTPGFFCIDNFTTQSPVTGIAKKDEKNISLYPNPANESLTIDISSLRTSGISTVQMVDVSGRCMETITTSSPVIHLPVSDYKSGVYFISVKNANAIINGKFIKN